MSQNIKKCLLPNLKGKCYCTTIRLVIHISPGLGSKCRECQGD